MKTKQIILKGIILILFFGLILNQISAQNNNQVKEIKKNSKQQVTTPTSQPSQPSPPSPPSPPPPPPPVPDIDPDYPPPPLDLPDLTVEQQEKIKKTDLKQIEAMTPLRNQMREKRVRLASILTTMPMDIALADQLADEIGKLASAILKLQIRHDQELRNILTTDQQIIFDSRPKPFLKRK